MDDLDIYQSAKRLLDLYGSDAMTQAAMRQAAMIERGDMEGAAVWKRIVWAVAEVQATEGRTVH